MGDKASESKSSESGYSAMLDDLDQWWQDCCQFVSLEGDCKPYDGFQSRAYRLQQHCLTHTKVDPHVIREMTRKICRYVGQTSVGPHPNGIEEIRDYLEVNCIGLVDQIAGIGTDPYGLQSENPTGQPDSKTDSRKKTSAFLPQNDDVTKLAKYMRENDRKGATMLGLAREYTEGNEKKAKNLNDQLRHRFRHLLNGTRFERKNLN